MTSTLNNTLDTEIPIIDFGPFLAGSAKGKRAVAAEIGRAAEKIGFFYIAQPPVPPEIVSAALDAVSELFALPLEDKLKVKINEAHRGYLPIGGSSYDDKLKPNVNESFLIGLDLQDDDPDVRAGTPMHGANQWPADFSPQRRALDVYFRAMMAFGDQLLRACALALDLPENHFASAYVKPMPFIRCVHYPSQTTGRPDNEFGSATHTDNGMLTLLVQDEVGGLQVQRRDGTWIDAVPVPNTYVINIGDMLMRWTNDKWISTPHRVINISGRDRYSIPFFYNPAFATPVECIPSCLPAGQTAKYPPITWGEYFTAKFAKTYAYRKAEQ